MISNFYHEFLSFYLSKAYNIELEVIIEEEKFIILFGLTIKKH